MDDGHANYTKDAYPGPPEWQDLSDPDTWEQGGGTFYGAPGRHIAGSSTGMGSLLVLAAIGLFVMYADAKVPR